MRIMQYGHVRCKSWLGLRDALRNSMTKFQVLLLAQYVQGQSKAGRGLGAYPL